MRYSPFLIPFAALGLAACAAGGSSQQTTVTQTVRPATAGYLTSEQSSGLIILPGDTTTPVQLQALGKTDPANRDGWQVAASADTGAQETPLLASNLSR